MKKCSVKKMGWLKGLHILLAGIWLGTGISMFALGNVNELSSSDLHAVFSSIKLLDDYLIIPASMGTFLTGVLLCWFTNWGFFKYKWIILKWMVGLAQMVMGIAFLGPWLNSAVAIVATEGEAALQNATFLNYMQMNNILSLLQLLLLIFVLFLSVFKPWGKVSSRN